MQRNDTHVVDPGQQYAREMYQYANGKSVPARQIERRWNEYHRGPRTGNRLARYNIACRMLPGMLPESFPPSWVPLPPPWALLAQIADRQRRARHESR
jgi:hypothetical protein